MFLKGLDKDVLPRPHLENTVRPFKENHSARLGEDARSSVLLTSHIPQKHLHNILSGPRGGLMSRGGPARWRIRQAKCEIKQQMRPCSLTLVVVEVDGDRDWEGGGKGEEGAKGYRGHKQNKHRWFSSPGTFYCICFFLNITSPEDACDQ